MCKRDLEQGFILICPPRSLQLIINHLSLIIKIMPIYTRTGDKGKTDLFGGARVSKADLRIETLGTIDELNSTIGVALSETRNKKQETSRELIKIQNDLLNIGSLLANPTPCYILHATYYIKRVRDFENLIDEMTKVLPPLKNFILPGGGRAGAMLHLARAICRRAERRIVKLKNSDRNIIIYLNRLSDLLFALARFANFKDKKKERIWKKI